MKKYRVVIGVACVVVFLLSVGFFLVKDAHFDVLQPSGDIAKQQRNLLVFASLVMAVVVVPVFILLGWFGWKYRAGNKSTKKKDYKPEWHENKRLEILWWGIPALMIGTLAVTAWVTSHSLDPYKKLDSDKAAIEVQVVALQWKWLFIYPDLGIATVNKLPVPEKTPIHFTISADAPMSAFWVPALGTQIYAMNGMSSQLNLIADHTGEFPGYTTNINGEGYSDMKFTVSSQSDDDFTKWVAATKKSPNLMNETQYERLAVPGTVEATSYALVSSSLYTTIVNKYMGHGMAHSNHDGTHTMDDGSTMSDSKLHEHMEGM